MRKPKGGKQQERSKAVTEQDGRREYGQMSDDAPREALGEEKKGKKFLISEEYWIRSKTMNSYESGDTRVDADLREK